MNEINKLLESNKVSSIFKHVRPKFVASLKVSILFSFWYKLVR